jgi:translation initiation factor 5B
MLLHTYLNIVENPQNCMMRQPIVSMMGHVDHGKTSLLDYIRGTAVASKEAGGITQAIGASIIPLATIKGVCGPLLDALKLNLTIPGLLFVDTPGHAAFINLRKRGGNLADMAILTIDITKGFEPQTIEVIHILKQYKTPFIIALNKVDVLMGWQTTNKPILASLESQSKQVKTAFETKMYEIVGKLYEEGINADRFDRVSDHTKQIALVPTSAKTGEGVPELLMVLTGLAQRYLEGNLQTVDGPGKGTVVEVKESAGLGMTMDTILYEGQLNAGDTIVIGGIEEPIVTKVKALLVPDELADMRESKTKFKTVKQVTAAMGVKISGPDLDQVQAGMPFVVAEDVETAKQEVMADVEEVMMETDNIGVIIKADTLGSLEALEFLLKEKNIPIKKASVGPVTKRDLSDAKVIADKDQFLGVILGFNIPEAEDTGNIKAFTSPIIYKLIEDYEHWKEGLQRNLLEGEMDKLPKPCKVQLLSGYVFRQSSPAIVGTEILEGTLKSGTSLINEKGEPITQVKGIQHEQENISEAKKGMQVAVSYPGVVVGRHVREGDILYSAISENDFRQFKDFKEHLSEEDKSLLKEIAAIMREENPVWGI